MSDHIPPSDLERRTWDVFERALDAAIAAEPGDIAALELGVRVAELLMNSRVVSPPRVRRSDDVDAQVLDTLLEPQERFAVRVGSALAIDDASALVQLLTDGRRAIAREFGVVIPAAAVSLSEDLDECECEVLVNGDVVLRTDTLDSESPSHDAASRINEVATAHLADFLTREEVAELLNVARRDSPMVVQELVPNMLSLGQLRSVLRNLVREQVPIRDLSTILNTLADHSVYTKDPFALTEHVRQALGRKLCAKYGSDDGVIKGFLLSPDTERAIQNAIQLNETGQVLMLDPNTSQAIQNNLAGALERHRAEVGVSVVMVPPKIRRHVKVLLDRNFQDIVVMSYAELVPGSVVDALETIEAHAPGSPRDVPPVQGSGDSAADAGELPGDADGWNW